MSSDPSVPSSFSSPSAEASFWKSRAAALSDELHEFQEGSRELEAELETQLEQTEGRLKEFRSAANRLQMENEQIKDKLEQCQREYHAQVNELESELSEIKSIRDQLNTYVRELEQSVDDLERAKRSTIASLEDFETRLNVAIERNAFLESELDEKENLKAAIQHMKDETRDLKSELRVLTATNGASSSSSAAPDNDRESNNNQRRKSASADSNKLASEGETKSEVGNVLDTPPVSAKNSPSVRSGGARGSMGGGRPLTPSARISALNIVGDLLRKVGALELKLVSCRNIVKESGNTDGVNQTEEAPAAMTNGGGRLPRGSSTPAIKKLVDSS